MLNTAAQKAIYKENVCVVNITTNDIEMFTSEHNIANAFLCKI